MEIKNNKVKENNNDMNRENKENKENKEKKENKTKITIIGVILAIIILVIVIFTIAYAKYITSVSGQATGEIAKMICEMNVTSSEANKQVINPYCIVTVKNYNENNEITETDVNFKIEVAPKDNFEMPEYYWQNSEGVIVAQSTVLTGSFKNGLKDLKEYKIVFLNSGEEDITRLVDFNLVAIQANE